MDGSSFDTLSRVIGRSRRALLVASGASALGALGIAALLGTDDAGAKKGGRKRRRRRCKPKPAGSACQTSKDCCTKKTKRVCGGDPSVCCGQAGASCELLDDCCEGFTCGVDGTCVEIL